MWTRSKIRAGPNGQLRVGAARNLEGGHDLQHAPNASKTAAADAERLGYEAGRQALVADAHRSGLLDVFELASLTGLTPEHIRKMTRG
ncbi:hypothetical protein [Arthrobacter silvisoli]|uniref:hypothetical protein n=1 Tax=Arthrobacter silvisoli TaxID=2291022 RepID=UPI000E20DDB3|nr:hypothetical protein [Arthrobacter silvisoli]